MREKLPNDGSATVSDGCRCFFVTCGVADLAQFGGSWTLNILNVSMMTPVMNE